MEFTKYKRFWMNPRAKRMIQMVNEPSDDETNNENINPNYCLVNTEKSQAKLQYIKRFVLYYGVSQKVGENAEIRSEKLHEYDLRDVQKKSYEDFKDTEDAFSSDTSSEFLPSPYRANSSESASLGEDTLQLNQILRTVNESPSSISGLCEIFGNEDDFEVISKSYKGPPSQHEKDAVFTINEEGCSADLRSPLHVQNTNENVRFETQVIAFTSRCTLALPEISSQSTMITTDQNNRTIVNLSTQSSDVGSEVELHINEIVIDISPERDPNEQPITLLNESPMVQETVVMSETASSSLQENLPSTSRAACNMNDCVQLDDSSVVSEKQLTRKRRQNYDEWKVNKSKKLKNTGKAYTACRSKKQFSAKTIGPVCKCKLNYCAEKFSLQSRQDIFDEFYSLGTHELKWQYIVKYVRSETIKKMQLERKNNRIQTLKYHFPLESSIIRVCKVFFLNTLAISEQTVYTAIQKYDSNVNMTDNIGKHSNRPRKMNEMTEDNIVTHIQQFPVKEAHYVRKSSQKKYLCETLNISKMYRLYTEWFKENVFDGGITMGSKRQYETIFNTKFNYSFFRHKKDQCARCVAYDLADEETKRVKEEEHKKHLANKDRVRDIKREEKENADERTCIAVFDMEKVLSIPKSEVGVFHYKRKYPVYNFTVFESLNLKGHCYMWHLQIAKRGAIEIGSCLLQFIEQQHAKGITKMSFYSDGCVDQNKNRYVLALYQYAANKFGMEITHRYFETGHGENEGDSMHSCIERALKHQVLYTPDQMYGVVMNAKVKGEKYSVIIMDQKNFYNIKDLITGKNWLCDINGNKVLWSKIRQFSVSHTDPDSIFLKYDYDGEVIQLNTKVLTRKSRKRKLGADCPATSSSDESELKQAYTSLIPVPKALYTDLMSLCRTGAIPLAYHGFYNSLICQNNDEEAEQLSDENDE